MTYNEGEVPQVVIAKSPMITMWNLSRQVNCQTSSIEPTEIPQSPTWGTTWEQLEGGQERLDAIKNESVSPPNGIDSMGANREEWDKREKQQRTNQYSRPLFQQK